MRAPAWVDAALQLIEEGLEPAQAAVAAGAGAEAEHWVKDPANAPAIRDAEACAEVALLEIAKTPGGAGARWLLERRFPERYGPGVARKVKQVENGQAEEFAESALQRAERRRRRGHLRLALVASEGA
jgi:hypothetical protein